MFEVHDDSSEGSGAHLSRVCANIYQSDYSTDSNYIVGFSRVNGTIYLDYYRNGVHMKKIPREPLFSDFAPSAIPSFNAFLGEWTGSSDYEGDYNGRFELTMSRGEVRRGVEYCQFHLDYRGRLIWDAECAYDPSTGEMIMYTMKETDVNFNKYTGETSPETTELFNYGSFSLDEYGRLHLDLMDEDIGNLGWVLEEIDGTFIRYE